MNRKIKLGYVFLSLVVAAVISCSSDKKSDEGVPADVAEATSDAGGAPADPNAPPAGDANAAAPADANAAAPADPNAPPPPPGDQAAAAPADPNAPPAAPGEPGKAPETTESEMAAADQAAGQAPGAPGEPGAPPAAPGDAAAAPPAAPDANAAAPAPDAGAPAADANAAPPPPADTSTTTASNDSGAGGGGGGDLFGAGGGDASASGEAPAPKHHGGAVAHIKTAPFTKGGQNLNTVYIAREGDTLDSISQKLFGEDRTKQLKKANPALKKGVKTGDKVYFTSPNRPDDKEKMLTVYEDQGMEPAKYTTKDGDTLKSLAQEWYGSESSWKEIYALNLSLTSTKELPAGTELMYWPATAAVAVYGAKKEGTDVAQNNPPPADAGAGAPGNNPPPPPGNNPPPPPDANANPPGGAAGTTGNAGAPPPPANNLPPPPPPPDMNAANPPPPPIAAPPKKHHEPANALAGMDKDTIMYAVAAGLFLVGGGLLVAIRRRNARRNSGITQV